MGRIFQGLKPLATIKRPPGENKHRIVKNASKSPLTVLNDPALQFSGRTTVVLVIVLLCCGTLRGDVLPAVAPPERAIKPEQRQHWSYLPLAKPDPPAVSDDRWNGHPIDRFLRASMLAARIDPLPRVGQTTLLRRLSFDLAGLPPTIAEINDFVDDSSPDCVDRLVDRLLASRAYAERWAQHWLDLARYAETDGFEHDLVRPNAWRYRDWVIDALNRDMPYDEFVRLQLAGDELRPGDPDAAIATGFLLCGPDMPDINLQEERRHFVLNEMTATVGSVFLGLQLGCAQCHDHKFDAISLHDFYRLRAFFESVDIFRDHPVPSAAELSARARAEKSLPADVRQKMRRRDELEKLGRQRLHEKNPDLQPTAKQIIAELSKDERKEHAAIVSELDKAVRLPELPLGRVVKDGQPRDAHVFLRGDFRQPGPVVRCGYPRILDSPSADPVSPEHPRAVLADWLTRTDRPLFARVIANRLWQWHFGAGLSTMPSDFGIMGQKPTHPELLDWLARRFAEDGWSLKRMHRLLVSSEAYQAASAPFDPGWSPSQIASAKKTWDTSHARDTDNFHLWHRRRTRLDGESIRDAMLAASGLLSTRSGGESIRPPLPPEVTATLLANQWPVSKDPADFSRRGIFLFVRRNLRYPLFDVFDRPDTNASCAMRHESTTATQSLVLFNSEFSLDCSRALAADLIASFAKDRDRSIREAYLRILNRPANAEEIQAAKAFLDRQGVEHRSGNEFSTSLIDFCLALFNASEFVYVD